MQKNKFASVSVLDHVENDSRRRQSELCLLKHDFNDRLIVDSSQANPTDQKTSNYFFIGPSMLTECRHNTKQ